MSDSLQPHGLQHARLPCLSLSHRACSNSCLLNWWCHPTISSSVVPFSFYLQTQHQGLFQWVSSLHHVVKVLELQFQHPRKKNSVVKGGGALKIHSNLGPLARMAEGFLGWFHISGPRGKETSHVSKSMLDPEYKPTLPQSHACYSLRGRTWKKANLLLRAHECPQGFIHREDVHLLRLLLRVTNDYIRSKTSFGLHQDPLPSLLKPVKELSHLWRFLGLKAP